MFPALEEIIRCLCENFEPPQKDYDPSKKTPPPKEYTPEERYQKIMRLLMGVNFDKENTAKNRGGQNSEFKNGYNMEKIFIAMFFLCKFYDLDSLNSAKVIINNECIVRRGTPHNMARKLAEQYKKFSKFSEYPERAKFYRSYRSQIQAHDWFVNNHFSEVEPERIKQIENIIKTLRENDWLI